MGTPGVAASFQLGHKSWPGPGIYWPSQGCSPGGKILEPSNRAYRAWLCYPKWWARLRAAMRVSPEGCVTHAEHVTSEGHVTFVSHIIPQVCCHPGGVTGMSLLRSTLHPQKMCHSCSETHLLGVSHP